MSEPVYPWYAINMNGIESIKELPYDFSLRSLSKVGGVKANLLLPVHKTLLVMTCQYFRRYFKDSKCQRHC